MKKLLIFILAFGVFIVGFDCVQSQNSENQKDSPAAALTDYYDAVNKKQYKKAFEYWKNPTQTFDEFVKDYAETKSVQLIINQDNPIEGAAGSLYSEIPTVIVATMNDGSQKTFFGCYTMRKSNLQPPDIPKLDTWHIYKGELKPAPQGADTSQLLSEACGGNSGNTNPPENDSDKSSRILGALGFNSTAEQSISAPASVKANEDFEITVTTSGNGCISAADSSVVLTDDSADVFVYDFTSANRPGVVCTMIFKSLPHKATLRFTKTGKATIRVWGRKQGNDSPLGEPVVIKKQITVN